MWIKFLLWAILIGSIVMGYLGDQTGSATNAAIGIGIFIIGAFALFFILKLFLKLGFFVVKIILIFALIAIIILSGIKGCQYLVNKGNQVNQTQTEKIDAAHSEMMGKSVWQKMGDFFSLSKFGMKQPQPIIPPTPQKENTKNRVKKAVLILLNFMVSIRLIQTKNATINAGKNIYADINLKPCWKN